jgi:hypothetical protein
VIGCSTGNLPASVRESFARRADIRDRVSRVDPYHVSGIVSGVECPGEKLFKEDAASQTMGAASFSLRLDW